MEKYIYRINLLIRESADDESIQLNIDEAVERFVLQSKDSGIEFVSTQVINLYDDNCGQCCICGAWTSDHAKENSICEFSDGEKLEGKWYCDICLPENHEKHF